MPDGIFPSEDWLRKRGKYANRPGESYNTLAVRVNSWLGGTRILREILGHPQASTTKWTPEAAIKAWREFHATYGLTPTQLASDNRKDTLPSDVVKLANKIRQANVRQGTLDEARAGKTARKIVWTEERTIAAWRKFENEIGKPPSSCLSPNAQRKLPRAIVNRAAGIYGAAGKLGILERIRGK